MPNPFRLKAFLSYGARAARRKAAALVLLLAAAGPAWTQPTAIMAFGDSLTAGYGLMDHEGLVPQLRDWLAGQGKEIRVIGAGVSGDTTAGGLSRLDWSLSPEVRGLIVTLGGNDALRGIDPAVSRENLRGILQIAADRDIAVLLVGMPAPVNFGPEYRAAFAAMYPDLAQEFGALYFGDFFAGLGDGSPAELQHLFQPDGIHPNAEGVALIVEALGPSVLDLIERAEQQD